MLKEPLYMLLAVVELICAVQIVRAHGVWRRVAAVVVVILCAYALESVRVGGWLLAVVGSTVGVATAVILPRPRLALISVVAAPIVLMIALWQAPIQSRVMAMLQEAAFQHSGHLATAGHSYQLLDARFYPDRTSAYTMTFSEAGRFVIRALASFATVPRPSQIQSRLCTGVPARTRGVVLDSGAVTDWRDGGFSARPGRDERVGSAWSCGGSDGCADRRQHRHA